MDIYYYPLENKYYQWYNHFIYKFQKRNWQPKQFPSIKHHIQPDSFYIHSKRNSKNGWLKGDPDHINNLLYVTEREHFILHWLLTKCYIGLPKIKMCKAFRYMTKNNKTSRFYAISRTLYNNAIKISRIDIVCNICNKPYKVIPFRKNSLYCSLKCNYIAKQGSGNTSYKGLVSLICQYCNISYQVQQYRKNTSKFCCKSHASKGGKKRSKLSHRPFI